MTPLDFKTEKLSKNEARKLISEILSRWPENIKFSKHAEEELMKDGLSTGDVFNLCISPSSKIIDEGECINGSWRYRLQTTNLVIVVSFWPTGQGFTVITGWVKRR